MQSILEHPTLRNVAQYSGVLGGAWVAMCVYIRNKIKLTRRLINLKVLIRFLVNVMETKSSKVMIVLSERIL